MLKQHQKSTQGFTLIEVLVAILIMTTFTLVALEAMVISAVFKVRAAKVAEATNEIQKDLESVKGLATSQYITGNCSATLPANGYAQSLITLVGTTLTSPVNITMKGQVFALTRTTAVYATAPYKIMTVTYNVSPTAGGSSIASSYTEVIPDVALSDCAL